MSFDLGKEPEGKEAQVELSTFSICVCINTQKKDTQPTKKTAPENMYPKAYLIYFGFININVCSASTDLRYDKAQSPSSAKPLFTPITLLLFSHVADISKWVLVGLIIFILWELIVEYWGPLSKSLEIKFRQLFSRDRSYLQSWAFLVLSVFICYYELPQILFLIILRIYYFSKAELENNIAVILIFLTLF